MIVQVLIYVTKPNILWSTFLGILQIIFIGAKILSPF